MERKNNKYTKEISAGVIIYRKTKKGIEFLLLHHGRDYWNFPKGRLEAGETEIQGAIRETEEETGLKLDNLIFTPKFKVVSKYHTVRGKKDVFKVVTFFLARSNSSRIKISSEHEDFGWFLFKDSVKMLRYRGSKRAIGKAIRFISKKKNNGKAGTKRRKNNDSLYRL